MATKSNNNRTITIWAALVGSMTIGAIVLMALDNKKISAGAFSLASFQELDSVSHVLKAADNTDKSAWQSIQVSYSGTIGGNIESISLATGQSDPAKADFHFIIGNGDGVADGKIVSTQKWLSQVGSADNDTMIKVVVVSDGVKVRPTDTQIKRLSNLLDTLARKFNIASKQINQPLNLEM